MSKRLAVVLALVAVALGTLSLNGPTPVHAANTNVTDSANISVLVAALTLVDVTPNRLVFNASGGLNPGSVGTGSDLYNTNREKPGSIQIENIGSTNITHIWMNTTYESSNPFGQGNANNYDAANFVVVSRENAGSYYFVNRVEYNETRSLVYVNVPNGWRYGRIRNTTYEYFWAVQNQSNQNNCNTTTVRIGINYHSQSVEGSTNFDPSEGATAGTDYNEFTLTDAGSSEYVGYANINAGPWNGYCIAVWNCGEKLMLYKYNIDAPGGTACTNADYFWDNATDGNLHPGNSTVADLRVRIPYGVMMGTVKEGTLTVIAQSDQAT